MQILYVVGVIASGREGKYAFNDYFFCSRLHAAPNAHSPIRLAKTMKKQKAK